MRDKAESRRRWPRRSLWLATAEWRELGALGRIALIGVGISAIIALALGFVIPRVIEQHLIDERSATMATVTEALATRDLVPTNVSDVEQREQFDEAVRQNLLGGETVRVKVWSQDGTIVYSDVEDLIGENFSLPEAAASAFQGEVTVKSSDPEEPENVFERDIGDLLEFYVPIEDANGDVIAVFEVYQLATPLQDTVSQIRWTVRSTIAIGLGIMGLFMSVLTLAIARVANRRKHQAENLLSGLLHAQEEERGRIVGALHDDIGQPLYRLLYGLQGSRSRLSDDEPVSEELAVLEDLVKGVDRTLRAELKMLHQDTVKHVGLARALAQLVETTRAETDLQIDLEIEIDADDEGNLGLVGRSALFRAAQEALTNARKHAEASQVSIRVVDAGRRVTLDVDDDGEGIQGAFGLGLATTAERLDAIGGGLLVSNRRTRGTSFRAWAPAGDEEDVP